MARVVIVDRGSPELQPVTDGGGTHFPGAGFIARAADTAGLPRSRQAVALLFLACTPIK
jgi:hypothetical protein